MALRPTPSNGAIRLGYEVMWFGTMAHLEPAHLALGGKKGREEEKRSSREEGGEKRREKIKGGAARFGVLILQINLDPHAFSHMAEN